MMTNEILCSRKVVNTLGNSYEEYEYQMIVSKDFIMEDRMILQKNEELIELLIEKKEIDGVFLKNKKTEIIEEGDTLKITFRIGILKSQKKELGQVFKGLYLSSIG